MNSILEPNGGTNGYELWMYDGVNAPSMVADINPGSGSSFPVILPSSIMNFILEADDDI